jgi:ABC-type uncharacterized transport system YnjBCD ATPase subunit
MATRKGEDLAAIRELISEATADTRELRAAAVKAHQQLGDRQSAKELQEIGTNILFALSTLLKWVDRQEEFYEALDMRGMASAKPDLIKQRRDKLNQLLEERETYDPKR